MTGTGVIILSGQPRFLLENLPSLRNLARSFSVAICRGHFWIRDEADRQAVEQFSQKEGNFFESIDLAFDAPMDKAQLVASAGAPEHFGEIHFIPAALSQYTSLQRAWSKTQEAPSPDACYLRTRTDLLVPEKLKFDRFKPGEIIVPSSAMRTGLCDFFALGDRAGMSAYISTIKTMQELSALGLAVPPEIALALHLGKNNVSVRCDRALPHLLLGQKEGRWSVRNSSSRLQSQHHLRFGWAGLPGELREERGIFGRTGRELLGRLQGLIYDFGCRRFIQQNLSRS